VFSHWKSSSFSQKTYISVCCQLLLKPVSLLQRQLVVHRCLNNSKMLYDITNKTLQLPTSAVNMTLPAFAAERLLQIDISLRALGGRLAANLRSLDGTDRRKDPRPFHRLCVHFLSGLNNFSPLCQVPLQRLRDSAHFIFRRDHSLKL